MADIDELLRHGKVTNVTPGFELTREGTPGRDVFYVLEGTARVTANGRLVTHLGADALIGEMALIDHGPRSATVVADSAMRVVTLDATAFASLTEHPGLCRVVQRQLVGRLRAALLSNTSESTTRRYLS